MAYCWIKIYKRKNEKTELQWKPLGGEQKMREVKVRHAVGCQGRQIIRETLY